MRPILSVDVSKGKSVVMLSIEYEEIFKSSRIYEETALNVTIQT